MPMNELLGQGATITVIGLGLVFAALALVWGFFAGLTRLFPGRPEAGPAGRAEDAAPVLIDVSVCAAQSAPAEGAAGGTEIAAAAASLSAERARVAAIVAGALMANALPKPHGVSAGPTFEHGRTAPSWVSTNRAQSLRPWQPPRQ